MVSPECHAHELSMVSPECPGELSIVSPNAELSMVSPECRGWRRGVRASRGTMMTTGRGLLRDSLDSLGLQCCSQPPLSHDLSGPPIGKQSDRPSRR